jgi:peptide-methionine (R)-S-oxide reductase
MPEPENLTEDQWRERLTAEQFQVLRKKGTERAFTGKYWNEKTQGVYKCAGCGWPSFFRPLDESKVEMVGDRTHGMIRDEVVCKRCGGHLGHVFDDGPTPTGLRYCINSVSIDLDPSEK